MHPFIRHLLAATLLVTVLANTLATPTPRSSMPRTIVTTDMEQDDLASLIRYLLYTNELDTKGIIYTASRWHWAGNGAGTKFFLPDREYSTPQWTWRWTGTHTIQDKVLTAYADIWPNLLNHDPFYPTPDELLALVKIGNIDFEGEMSHDSDGSRLIAELLLDEGDDDRPLYLQAWGGTNTIARALKSIEEEYAGTSQWEQIKSAVSAKAVLLASGFQDKTYEEYIAPRWPDLRVEDLEVGYATWGSAVYRVTMSTTPATGSTRISRQVRTEGCTGPGWMDSPCPVIETMYSGTEQRRRLRRTFVSRWVRMRSCLKATTWHSTRS